MIAVGPDGGTLLVGAVAVAALGWSAVLGILAADRGPGWAREHLLAADRVIVAVAVGGAATALVVAPRWVGPGIVWVAAVVWVLAGYVRLVVERAEGGAARALPPARRAAIVRSARRGYGALGAAAGAVSVAAWDVGPVAWVGLAAAAVLAGTAVLLR